MFGDAVALSWSDFFGGGGVAPQPVTNDPWKGAAGAPIPQTTGAQKTWAQWGEATDNPPGSEIDKTTTTTTAADTRTTKELDARMGSELQSRIQAAGGVLTVSPNSSNYIVAINNPLKFSVTRNAAGQYEIRASQNFYYLIGAAVLIGVLLLAKK